jgi:hypothetical protein
MDHRMEVGSGKDGRYYDDEGANHWLYFIVGPGLGGPRYGVGASRNPHWRR